MGTMIQISLNLEQELNDVMHESMYQCLPGSNKVLAIVVGYVQDFHLYWKKIARFSNLKSDISSL